MSKYFLYRNIEHVYELVDITSDETHYTICICPSFIEAEKVVEGFDRPIGEHGDCDVGIYEIRERKLNKANWSDTGPVVARYKLEEKYDENLDEDFWILTKEKL